MRVTTRMYRDAFDRARLFWKCEDCGLEWRDAPGMAEPGCPRCEARELRHALMVAKLGQHPNVRLLHERNSARKWAAAWKREAKSQRAYYSGQGDYLHEVAETRDDYKDLSAVYRCQRDSARRVARALYHYFYSAETYWCGADLDTLATVVRKVLAEEAKK